jgi:DNA-binding winged helix-turn-helix (wHTH) protein
VLVALARAKGRTVSHDELAESCWQGRVMGEDALNCVIAKLCDIAAGPAEGSFEIESIKRVSYRIVATGESAAMANVGNLAVPPIVMHTDAAIVGR